MGKNLKIEADAEAAADPASPPPDQVRGPAMSAERAAEWRQHVRIECLKLAVETRATAQAERVLIDRARNFEDYVIGVMGAEAETTEETDD